MEYLIYGENTPQFFPYQQYSTNLSLITRNPGSGSLQFFCGPSVLCLGIQEQTQISAYHKNVICCQRSVQLRKQSGVDMSSESYQYWPHPCPLPHRVSFPSALLATMPASQKSTVSEERCCTNITY